MNFDYLCCFEILISITADSDVEVDVRSFSANWDPISLFADEELEDQEDCESVTAGFEDMESFDIDHPLTGQKCHCSQASSSSLATIDTDGAPLLKAQKVVDHKGCAQRKDFARDVEDVIKTASDIFRVFLIVHCRFPINALTNDWILNIWARACESEDIHYAITNELYVMVCCYSDTELC